jgi:hypothetical protein
MKNTNNNGWKDFYLPTTTADRMGRDNYYVSAGKDILGYPMETGYPNQRPRKDVKVFSAKELGKFEQEILKFPFWTLAKVFRDSIEIMREATFPTIHMFRMIFWDSWRLGSPGGVYFLPKDSSGNVLYGLSTEVEGKWRFMTPFQEDVRLSVDTDHNNGLKLIRSNYWVLFDRSGSYNTGNHPNGSIMYFPGWGYIMKPTDNPANVGREIDRVTVFLKK